MHDSASCTFEGTGSLGGRERVCVRACVCVCDVCIYVCLVLQAVHVPVWGPCGPEVGGPLLRLEKGILIGK